MGDSSDNIPGIRGIGPKTAAKLVNTFGSLESIIDRCEEIESEKIRLAIKEGEEILKRNMTLIALGGDADIPFTLDEVEFNNPYIRTMEVIRGIGH